LRRLFDTNGILLDDRMYSSNLKAANEDSFFSHYTLYTPEEESSIRNSIAVNKDHIFTIKY
jgi:hypothetical protein